jgi:NIMA (never in mitosis gene a)-related kinase
MKQYQIGDRFTILKPIGKGAFSVVYKVRRIEDGKLYALKKIKLKTLKEKEIQNSLNEVRILASIKHPNIIGFKEAFYMSDKHELCVVMELA